MLTDDAGASVSFAGRALAEPAHYTTTVTVPHDGSWRVTGVQGMFLPFHVGTLTVPGTLKALGVPAAPSQEDVQKYWPWSGTPAGVADRPPTRPVRIGRSKGAGAAADAAASGGGSGRSEVGHRTGGIVRSPRTAAGRGHRGRRAGTGARRRWAGLADPAALTAMLAALTATAARHARETATLGDRHAGDRHAGRPPRPEGHDAGRPPRPEGRNAGDRDAGGATPGGHGTGGRLSLGWRAGDGSPRRRRRAGGRRARTPRPVRARPAGVRRVWPPGSPPKRGSAR